MHQHILKAWVSGHLSNTVLEIFCPSYLYWLLFLLIGYFNELLLFNEQYFKVLLFLPTVFKWENVLEEYISFNFSSLSHSCHDSKSSNTKSNDISKTGIRSLNKFALMLVALKMVSISTRCHFHLQFSPALILSFSVLSIYLMGQRYWAGTNYATKGREWWQNGSSKPEQVTACWWGAKTDHKLANKKTTCTYLLKRFCHTTHKLQYVFCYVSSISE